MTSSTVLAAMGVLTPVGTVSVQPATRSPPPKPPATVLASRR
jgi:hypothetical protein